jgi:hypothetical protein
VSGVLQLLACVLQRSSGAVWLGITSARRMPYVCAHLIAPAHRYDDKPKRHGVMQKLSAAAVSIEFFGTDVSWNAHDTRNTRKATLRFSPLEVWLHEH